MVRFGDGFPWAFPLCVPALSPNNDQAQYVGRQSGEAEFWLASDEVLSISSRNWRPTFGFGPSSMSLTSKCFFPFLTLLPKLPASSLKNFSLTFLYISLTFVVLKFSEWIIFFGADFEAFSLSC